MAIQEECLGSNAMGPGLSCFNSITANATSKSSDDLVIFELISEALNGKDFDELIEDIHVRNKFYLVA